ncbi:MAG: hypothetical protein ABIQ33_13345 [Caldimonas sp.]
MEVITSKERFLVECPCATLISSYVSELLGDQNVKWAFGKAIVRRTRTSAMFVCVDAGNDAHELWVTATQPAPGEWALQHSPVPAR